MVSNNIVITLYKDAMALFCAASLTISSAGTESVTSPLKLTPPPGIMAIRDINEHNAKLYMQTDMWRYLRKGINYLEASGKDIPLGLKHPGGVAYGPLALTPVAIKDVQLRYPHLRRYKFEDVISKRSVYEKFAVLYADLLLKHYIKIDYMNMPKEEVFQILEKAWFLGPTLYMKGRPIISSRETRASEYLKISRPHDTTKA